MTMILQQGQTGTIPLAFTNNGSVVPMPSSGGTCKNGNSNTGSASMIDQGNVKYVTNGLGTDVITYTGPTGSGLTATENVQVLATTATAVDFDETKIVITQTPPPG
jgi:hypothetical protein